MQRSKLVLSCSGIYPFMDLLLRRVLDSLCQSYECLDLSRHTFEHSMVQQSKPLVVGKVSHVNG